MTEKTLNEGVKHNHEDDGGCDYNDAKYYGSSRIVRGEEATVAMKMNSNNDHKGESALPAPSTAAATTNDATTTDATMSLIPPHLLDRLEDETFGWTHLTSEVLGHVLIPLGAFLAVQYVTRKIMELELERKNDRDGDGSDASGPTFCNARQDDSVLGRLITCLVEIISTWLSVLMHLLPIVAAVLAFRFVRQRRRVWFRHAYGTTAYKKDVVYRRQSLQETDRLDVLGRLRRRRHQRSLQRAEQKFAEKHRREEERRVQQRQQRLELELSPSPSSIMMTSSPGSPLISPCASSELSSPNPSFTTTPAAIGHDHVRIPILHKIPYAHGGFFGAAPFMLADKTWVAILRRLLPDVYVEISRRVLYSPASKLIHWAENNPVVAAYGAWHHHQQQQRYEHDHATTTTTTTTAPTVTGPYEKESTNKALPTIEWDVFLDPRLVRRVQAVLEARDQFLADNDDDNNDDDADDDDDGNPSSPRIHVLRHLDDELRKRSQELTDRLLIAHGNLWQLTLEQTGVIKDLNHSRILQTRKTLGGGMLAHHWMSVFAEALRLGSLSSGTEESSFFQSREDISWLYDMPMADSLAKIRMITGSRSPVGLVMDLKSRHVPKRVWAVVIDTLCAAGIRVAGIASFDITEIRGVTDLCVPTRRQTTREILFVHSAGDVQAACMDGIIRPGDHVFFNGGSLLYSEESFIFAFPFDPRRVQQSYKIHPFAIPSLNNNENATRELLAMNGRAASYWDLQKYKERFQFSLGCYLQEFAIDETALALLVGVVNDHAALYDLGLAWGGLNGVTVHGIQPDRFTATDGYWNQRRIGRMWKY